MRKMYVVLILLLGYTMVVYADRAGPTQVDIFLYKPHRHNDHYDNKTEVIINCQHNSRKIHILNINFTDNTDTTQCLQGACLQSAQMGDCKIDVYDPILQGCDNKSTCEITIENDDFNCITNQSCLGSDTPPILVEYRCMHTKKDIIRVVDHYVDVQLCDAAETLTIQDNTHARYINSDSNYGDIIIEDDCTLFYGEIQTKCDGRPACKNLVLRPRMDNCTPDDSDGFTSMRLRYDCSTLVNNQPDILERHIITGHSFSDVSCPSDTTTIDIQEAFYGDCGGLFSCTKTEYDFRISIRETDIGYWDEILHKCSGRTSCGDLEAMAYSSDPGSYVGLGDCNNVTEYIMVLYSCVSASHELTTVSLSTPAPSTDIITETTATVPHITPALSTDRTTESTVTPTCRPVSTDYTTAESPCKIKDVCLSYIVGLSCAALVILVAMVAVVIVINRKYQRLKVKDNYQTQRVITPDTALNTNNNKPVVDDDVILSENTLYSSSDMSHAYPVSDKMPTAAQDNRDEDLVVSDNTLYSSSDMSPAYPVSDKMLTAAQDNREEDLVVSDNPMYSSTNY